MAVVLRISALLVLVFASGCLSSRLSSSIEREADPLREFSAAKQVWPGRCVLDTPLVVEAEFPDVLLGEGRVLVIALERSSVEADWRVSMREVGALRPGGAPALLLRREPVMHGVSRPVDLLTFSGPAGTRVADFAPNYFFVYRDGGPILDRLHRKGGIKDRITFDAGRGMPREDRELALDEIEIDLRSVVREAPAKRALKKAGYAATVPLDLLTLPSRLPRF